MYEFIVYLCNNVIDATFISILKITKLIVYVCGDLLKKVLLVKHDTKWNTRIIYMNKILLDSDWPYKSVKCWHNSDFVIIDDCCFFPEYFWVNKCVTA